MTTERAQKIWEAFCGELIDNGVKDSEDVKQALATVFRKIVGDYEIWNDGTYMLKSEDILNIATELEAYGKK